ncbi:hypothetical protein CYY_007145 [Polysphondylium violaceum]|uniref:Selenoprotein F n=1 Tax=Polysphondylium violaceum TaxID=133409 RepID=A0A8J4PY20_9MYCE|nr:hypothetical protein CYY_007145 [Polysphondylium violaceum]
MNKIKNRGHLGHRVESAFNLSVVVLLFMFIGGSISVNIPQNSALQSTCHELGFTDALLCSTCDDFKEFVGDSDFYGECQKCCAEESNNEKKTFEFIEKKAADYKKLSVKYQSGSNPRLSLTDTNGKKEEINIESWKTENLEEYLKEQNL